MQKCIQTYLGMPKNYHSFLWKLWNGGAGWRWQNYGEGGVRSGRRPLSPRAQQPHHRRRFRRRLELQARCHRSFQVMEDGLGCEITSWKWPHSRSRIYCRCHKATEFSAIQWFRISVLNSVFSFIMTPFLNPCNRKLSTCIAFNLGVLFMKSD